MCPDVDVGREPRGDDRADIRGLAIGEVATPTFRFCGKEPIEGKPYCQFHCTVAYQRPRPVEKAEHQNFPKARAA